jgi:V/A-type H+/Na+-transporting ATPase subunit D
MNQDVKPTRAELREVKRRLDMARRGHRLLKRKQESLMADFFGRRASYRSILATCASATKEMRKDLALAEMASGRMGLWSYALTRNGALRVEAGERRIMGVRLPTITPCPPPAGADVVLCGEPPQNLEAAAAAQRWLAALVRRAEAEAGLRALLGEIERTKRRVTALEVKLIPRQEEARDFIQDHLDEMEREGLFVLKRVRSRLREAESVLNNQTMR